MLQKYFAPGSLFSYKSYRNFFISSAIFVIGASAFPIALAVTILDKGGDASALGLILAARVAAGTLFMLIGGVWADRLPRKWIMIGADSFRAAICLVLLFVSAHDLPLWAIGLLVFLMGLGDSFGAPAGSAIVPSLLPDHLLPSGNVARGIVGKVGNIVGPGVGGLSIAVIGADWTFGLIAGSFLFATTLIFTIKEDARQEVLEDKPTFLFELKEGFKLVWEIKWIAASIAMASFQLMVIVAADSGGSDAQGSQRGLEYDTISDRYYRWVETELLPAVTKNYGITFTKDPEGRGAMGGSSGAICAWTMAWFHPESYRKILSYSGTFVNQASPEDPKTPRGGWEYHAKLIPNSPKKPIRMWMHVSAQDNHFDDPDSTWHNWPRANNLMAAALKKKGYDHKYVWSEESRHVDPRVVMQTLPSALEWLWRDYPRN